MAISFDDKVTEALRVTIGNYRINSLGQWRGVIVRVLVLHGVTRLGTALRRGFANFGRGMPVFDTMRR